MKDGGRHLVVSSPREDHKTKKRLLTESRKQQESSAKGENTLKVWICSFHLHVCIYCHCNDIYKCNIHVVAPRKN